MPNIKSAIKRVEIAERNKIRNNAVKSTIKTAIRKLKDELSPNTKEEDISLLLNKCYSAIDKAVTKGVYKKNTAARKKSRLAQHVQKILKPETT